MCLLRSRWNQPTAWPVLLHAIGGAQSLFQTDVRYAVAMRETSDGESVQNTATPTLLARMTARERSRLLFQISLPETAQSQHLVAFDMHSTSLCIASARYSGALDLSIVAQSACAPHATT